MKDNKNRTRENEKTDPEYRRMEPKDHEDTGTIHGEKKGLHENSHEKNTNS
ncbi:MAG: hypothetical protein FWC47_08515 [Oscillospiraceae bacterium]|nr:hypothetical protein [Oscillospiraceae bacterium]